MATAKSLTAAILVLAFAAGCGGGSDKGSSSTQSGTYTGGSTGTSTPGFGNFGPWARGQMFAAVSSFMSDEVTLYDLTAPQSPLTSITTSGGPTDMAVSTAHGTQPRALYAAHLVSKELRAYDPLTYAQTATIDLKNAPLYSQNFILQLIGGIVSPYLHYAYMPMGAVEGAPGKFYVPGLFMITVVENGVATKNLMDLNLTTFEFNTLGAVQAAALNGKVFVTNFLADNVSVIDVATDTFVATIPVGSGPVGIAIDKYGTAYVACSFSGEVWTFNAAATGNNYQPGNVITTGGFGPIEVACDPQNGYVYVDHILSGEIVQIDGATGFISGTFMPSNLTALVQNMLTSVLGASGMGGTSPTATNPSSLTSLITSLLGGSGSASSGGPIAAIMNQLLTSMFGSMGITNMPMAGIWGLGVSPGGDVLVVANAFTGEHSFINTQTGAVVSTMSLFTGGNPSIPMITSVEVFQR